MVFTSNVNRSLFERSDKHMWGERGGDRQTYRQRQTGRQADRQTDSVCVCV